MIPTDDTPLIEARDVSVRFGSADRPVHALDGVSLTVSKGETVGLVGESGSGKSTLAKVLMRAIEPSAGSVRVDGRDITRLTARALKPVRRRVQMVFQDPYASLDPRWTVADIVAEPLRAHRWGSRRAIAERVAALLAAVGLPADAAGRLPTQFSGGQRQRIAIARALALEPDLIVADEPVSALDVSVQAAIVTLLRDLQKRLGIGYLVIAHDLALVHQIADRIAVMYLGRIVEEGTADAVVHAPQHPYTAALMSATPTPETAGRGNRLVLRGDPPSPIDRPSGCPFHPRCPIARDRCASDAPALAAVAPGARAACHYPGELPGPIPGPIIGPAPAPSASA